jgi:hypothetical protein
MNALADALVEAVLFIAFRSYDDNTPLEAYEEEDVRTLEKLKVLLQSATDAEAQSIAYAVDRAVAQLPPGHERIPYYLAFMENLFGKDEDPEEPTLEVG